MMKEIRPIQARFDKVRLLFKMPSGRCDVFHEAEDGTKMMGIVPLPHLYKIIKDSGVSVNPNFSSRQQSYWDVQAGITLKETFHSLACLEIGPHLLMRKDSVEKITLFIKLIKAAAGDDPWLSDLHVAFDFRCESPPKVLSELKKAIKYRKPKKMDKIFSVEGATGLQSLRLKKGPGVGFCYDKSAQLKETKVGKDDTYIEKFRGLVGEVDGILRIEVRISESENLREATALFLTGEYEKTKSLVLEMVSDRIVFPKSVRKKMERLLVVGGSDG